MTLLSRRGNRCESLAMAESPLLPRACDWNGEVGGRRRTGVDSYPGGVDGNGNSGTRGSHVVGCVLKKFARRNHFGKNFGDFLDKAYSHDESATTAMTCRVLSNADSCVSNGAKMMEAEAEEARNADGRRSKGEVRESSSLLLWPLQPSQDDATSIEEWVRMGRFDYGTDATVDRDGDKKGVDGDDDAGTTRSEGTASTKGGADPASARVSCDEDAAAMAEVEDEPGAFRSVSSRLHRGAVATLVAMFEPPWSDDLLGAVLEHNGHNLTRSVEMVLSHGDAPPEDLVRRLRNARGGGVADEDTEEDAAEGEADDDDDASFFAVYPRDLVHAVADDDVSALSMGSDGSFMFPVRRSFLPSLRRMLPAIHDDDDDDNDNDNGNGNDNYNDDDGDGKDKNAQGDGARKFDSAPEDTIHELTTTTIMVERPQSRGAAWTSNGSGPRLCRPEHCSDVRSGGHPDGGGSAVGGVGVRSFVGGASVRYHGGDAGAEMDGTAHGEGDDGKCGCGGRIRTNPSRADGGSRASYTDAVFFPASPRVVLGWRGEDGEGGSIPAAATQYRSPCEGYVVSVVDEDDDCTIVRLERKVMELAGKLATGAATVTSRDGSAPDASPAAAILPSPGEGSDVMIPEERNGRTGRGLRSKGAGSELEAIKLENAALKRQVKDLNKKLATLQSTMDRVLAMQEHVVDAALVQRREMKDVHAGIVDAGRCII